MDKQSLIENLQSSIKAGSFTKEELLAVYEKAIQTDTGETMARQSKISNILYFIGGAIVFMGICIFVGSNWSSLSDVTKVLATLGSSVALYVAAVLLSRYDNLDKVADALYFISALVAPFGILTAMSVAKMDTGTSLNQTTVAGILLIVYLLSYFTDRRNVFFIFSVIFGTWFFFCLTTLMVGGRPFQDWDFIKYRWLAVGLTHMILGYALVNTNRKNMTPALYGFGVVEFLTAALCLGGPAPSHNPIWEILFPGFIFGILFLSVYLRSRAFLVFGTIYLMAYLLKITDEYFRSGFGWALSLIFMGFALIAIGYGAFYLNKKYISQAS